METDARPCARPRLFQLSLCTLHYRCHFPVRNWSPTFLSFLTHMGTQCQRRGPKRGDAQAISPAQLSSVQTQSLTCLIPRGGPRVGCP